MVVDGLPATMKDLRPSNNQFIGEVSLESLPQRLQYLDIANNQLSANPTGDGGPGSVQGWTSTTASQHRTFLNPDRRRFCHGHQRLAGGHRMICIGQDQYPALGEIRDIAATEYDCPERRISLLARRGNTFTKGSV